MMNNRLHRKKFEHGTQIGYDCDDIVMIFYLRKS
jgi:hypothetical protein